jgi:hypothetical protein
MAANPITSPKVECCEKAQELDYLPTCGPDFQSVRQRTYNAVPVNVKYYFTSPVSRHTSTWRLAGE